MDNIIISDLWIICDMIAITISNYYYGDFKHHHNSVINIPTYGEYDD
jgi:hypothetical protein